LIRRAWHTQRAARNGKLIVNRLGTLNSNAGGNYHAFGFAGGDGTRGGEDSLLLTGAMQA
jgi:hypothetical protein